MTSKGEKKIGYANFTGLCSSDVWEEVEILSERIVIIGDYIDIIIYYLVKRKNGEIKETSKIYDLQR